MKFRILLIGSILILLPALGLAQKVSYDFDKAADFAGFKTYALKEGTKVGNPLVDDRITAAIESELKVKGLAKNDASPDVTVVYHIAFDKQMDISAWSTGGGPYGYRWGRGWGTSASSWVAISTRDSRRRFRRTPPTTAFSTRLWPCKPRSAAAACCSSRRTRTCG